MKFIIKKIIFKLGYYFPFLLTDYYYSKLLYETKLKKKLKIKKPETFNEKITWIKLYDKNPIYHILADKLAVRQYIVKKIGHEFLNELYDVFNSVEDIKLENLPKSFILKVTHGCGYNIICRNKLNMDWNNEFNKLKKWLKKDYYKQGREWAYKGIKPRIICEKLLLDSKGKLPQDYKFFCFHGLPIYVQVDFGRFEEHTRSFYDMSWNKCPFELEYPVNKNIVKKVYNFDKMVDIATKLSQNLSFIRIDLYNVDGKIFFGEMTIYPGNGSEKFSPHEYDKKLGQHLKLTI